MPRGFLSKEAAERIERPELTEKEVWYTVREAPTPTGVIAADVYHDGRRIAGTVSIGAGGIVPAIDDDRGEERNVCTIREPQCRRYLLP